MKVITDVKKSRLLYMPRKRNIIHQRHIKSEDFIKPQQTSCKKMPEKEMGM